MDNLYNRIEQLGKERGFNNITNLCKAANVRRSVLSELKSGRTSELSMRNAAKLANTLNVPVSWVMGSNESRSIIELVAEDNNLSAGVDLLRSIRHEKDTTKDGAVLVPVLGEVAAGIPIEAVENIIGYEEISEDLLANGGEYFALCIKGDSMEPRIMGGDVVIVKKQATVDTGDVAVVLVNGDCATVKRIKISSQGVMLIPNNASYEPMFYSNEEVETLPVAIIGKVVELRAKL